jgi:flavin reductase (DIM6/NTAB) family NADH-FMN oxidoreductase RutF
MPAMTTPFERPGAIHGSPSRHRVIASKIHYYGTPVVLISTVNADSSVNLSVAMAFSPLAAR